MRRLYFGAQQRIHTPAEFRQLLATPWVSRTSHLALHQLMHEGASARLGLVVAKRFARRSVERNRIKRVMREFFRSYPETLVAESLPSARTLPVGDYVVRLRQPFLADSARAQKQLLRAELGRLFERFMVKV